MSAFGKPLAVKVTVLLMLIGDVIEIRVIDGSDVESSAGMPSVPSAAV